MIFLSCWKELHSSSGITWSRQVSDLPPVLCSTHNRLKWSVLKWSTVVGTWHRDEGLYHQVLVSQWSVWGQSWLCFPSLCPANFTPWGRDWWLKLCPSCRNRSTLSFQLLSSLWGSCGGQFVSEPDERRLLWVCIFKCNGKCIKKKKKTYVDFNFFYTGIKFIFHSIFPWTFWRTLIF